MEGYPTVCGFVAESRRVGEEVGEEGRCVGVRSVMNHREEVLEVSKVQRGKGGVGERLESCTRKRVAAGRFECLTLCLFRMEPYLFIGKVSFKLNRN